MLSTKEFAMLRSAESFCAKKGRTKAGTYRKLPLSKQEVNSSRSSARSRVGTPGNSDLMTPKLKP